MRTLELKRRTGRGVISVYKMPREDIGAIYRDDYPEPGPVYCLENNLTSGPLTFWYTQDYGQALAWFHAA